MIRTVSIPITAPNAFLSFLENCNALFNRYVEWSFANNTHSKKKAHNELYEKIKLEYPNMPTALVQSVRDAALESVKGAKQAAFKRKEDVVKPVKKPYSMVRYAADP